MANRVDQKSHLRICAECGWHYHRSGTCQVCALKAADKVVRNKEGKGEKKVQIPDEREL